MEYSRLKQPKPNRSDSQTKKLLKNYLEEKNDDIFSDKKTIQAKLLEDEAIKPVFNPLQQEQDSIFSTGNLLQALYNRSQTSITPVATTQQKSIDPEPENDFVLHEVTSGQGAYAIATQYNVPIDTFLKINGLKMKGDQVIYIQTGATKVFQVGEKVKIPKAPTVEPKQNPNEQPKDSTATHQAPQSEIKDIKLGKDQGGKNFDTYKKQKVFGSLFVQGFGDESAVHYNDIHQGDLSNCYFMAAVMAIARQNPEELQKLIKDNGDGTYLVTLYAKGNIFSYDNTHTIQIDNTLPVQKNGNLAYGRSLDPGELWVSLIEKAYAQYMGGYDKIEYGNSGPVMERLTGKSSTSYWTATRSIETLASILEHHTKDKPNAAVTLGSYYVEKDSKEREKFLQYPVYPNHYYLLDKITGTGENMKIDLLNPWGYTHCKDFPIKDIKKIFWIIEILKP